MEELLKRLLEEVEKFEKRVPTDVEPERRGYAFECLGNAKFVIREQLLRHCNVGFSEEDRRKLVAVMVLLNSAGLFD